MLKNPDKNTYTNIALNINPLSSFQATLVGDLRTVL
jgi:hypothetical protein